MPHAGRILSPENPRRHDGVWEFYNGTADAHPMHIHERLFRVVDRQPINVVEVEAARTMASPMGGSFEGRAGVPADSPEPWENGLEGHGHRYPGQSRASRCASTTPGQYVWHCHIVEHEDNEMMRPYRIGPEQPGQPVPPGHGGMHQAGAQDPTGEADDSQSA